MNLCISPHGRLFVEAAPDSDEGAPKQITEAFTESPSRASSIYPRLNCRQVCQRIFPSHAI